MANANAKAYLILYNFTSAVLWSVILGRTILLTTLHSPSVVYAHTGTFAKWTQSLAVLEILHAAFRVVRAPLATTTMQVLSRLLLVWPVINASPRLARTHAPVYAAMLTAWSLTEVVRYSYFAAGVAGVLPVWLTKVRYSTFYVLYPVGIASECVLIYRAAGLSGRSWLETAFFYAVLAVYVPGSYILFTHMVKQRRKVMRSLKADQAKSQ